MPLVSSLMDGVYLKILQKVLGDTYGNDDSLPYLIHCKFNDLNSFLRVCKVNKLLSTNWWRVDELMYVSKGERKYVIPNNRVQRLKKRYRCDLSFPAFGNASRYRIMSAMGWWKIDRALSRLENGKQCHKESWAGCFGWDFTRDSHRTYVMSVHIWRKAEGLLCTRFFCT